MANYNLNYNFQMVQKFIVKSKAAQYSNIRK